MKTHKKAFLHRKKDSEAQKHSTPFSPLEGKLKSRREDTVIRPSFDRHSTLQVFTLAQVHWPRGRDFRLPGMLSPEWFRSLGLWLDGLWALCVRFISA